MGGREGVIGSSIANQGEGKERGMGLICTSPAGPGRGRRAQQLEQEGSCQERLRHQTTRVQMCV